MIKIYHGFYGEHACIRVFGNGSARLVIRDCYSRIIWAKNYDSFRGARIAMGRLGDGWREK